MRLGILGWDHEEQESLDLLHAGEELGHDTTLFTLDEVTFHLSTASVTAHVHGHDLRAFDLIVSRAQDATRCVCQ